MIYKCSICGSEIFMSGKKPYYMTVPCDICSERYLTEVYKTPQIEKGLEMGDKDDGTMREFGTGATRDTADGKLDPEGFTHPVVMKQFYKYMNMNRLQSDGNLRASDNWQKGIPKNAYMSSIKRHCDELWLEHRGFPSESGIIAALCGIMFNAMGYLLEILRDRNWHPRDFDGFEPTPEIAKRLLSIKKVGGDE